MSTKIEKAVEMLRQIPEKDFQRVVNFMQGILDREADIAYCRSHPEEGEKAKAAFWAMREKTLKELEKHPIVIEDPYYAEKYGKVFA